MRLSEESYITKLTKRYKAKVYVSGFVNFKTPAVHKCPKCSAHYKASPELMLELKSTADCRKCAPKKEEMNKAQSSFRLKLLKKFSYIKVESYFASNRSVKLKCTICNHSWDEKPASILKQKIGCPSCEANNSIKLTDSELREEITRNKLKVLKISKGVATVKGECSHTWCMTQVNAGRPACPVCSAPDGIAKLSGVSLDKVAHKPIPYTANGIKQEFIPHAIKGRRILRIIDPSELKTEQIIAKQVPFTAFYEDKQLIALPKEWVTWKENDLYNFVKSATAKDLVVLAMDPGVKNYAWSIIKQKGNDFEILATGMLNNPVVELKEDLSKQAVDFRAEILSIQQEFGANSVILERFMSRGNGGTTIELVNFMIGIVMSIPEIEHWKLITAAQWKNEFNRFADLEYMYKNTKCTLHQVDSSCIGIYGLMVWTGKRPFEGITSSWMNKLLKRLNNANN